MYNIHKSKAFMFGKRLLSGITPPPAEREHSFSGFYLILLDKISIFLSAHKKERISNEEGNCTITGFNADF